MRRRMHPLLVNACGSWTLSHILGDEAETRARLFGTILHGRFAGKLVRELIHLCHFQRVLVSRIGERGVPFQGRQTGGGTIMIRRVEKSLGSDAGLRR